MATLTGFTRISDPINIEQLIAHINTTTGKNIQGGEVTPGNIAVWGTNISESDRVAIQAAILTYTFSDPAAPVATWQSITSKPTSFTPEAHVHAIGDITNLQSSLDAKVPASTYAVIPAATTALGLATNNTVKVSPTANITYTTTVPAAGTQCIVIVLTNSATSRTITFGTGFKPTATLATGTVTARVFVVSFVSDGIKLYESSRTAAMVA